MSFAGLPGSLWLGVTTLGPEEWQEVCRQQEELSDLPAEVSGLRIQDWRSTVQGTAERLALVVRGKDKNKLGNIVLT